MSYFEVHDRAGDRYVPTDRHFTLGRGLSNNIVLHGNAVSRSHARISCQGSRVVLQDLDSTYGTLVNGRYVQGEVTLCDGDRVQMGDVYVVYREAPDHLSSPSDVTPPSGFAVLRGSPSGAAPVAARSQPAPARGAAPLPRTASQETRLPSNMVRCVLCGTANLRSNSICYHCGSALLPVSVRAGGHTKTSRKAPVQAAWSPQRPPAASGWLTGFLVAIGLLVFCVLSVILGLILAGGGPVSMI